MRHSIKPEKPCRSALSRFIQDVPWKIAGWQVQPSGDRVRPARRARRETAGIAEFEIRHDIREINRGGNRQVVFVAIQEAGKPELLEVVITNLIGGVVR